MALGVSEKHPLRNLKSIMQNPGTRDAILPVSVMLCMHTLIALGIFIIPVMAPEIGLDAKRISRFVPMLYLTAAIFAPFSGPFTGRFGPMRMMQACVFSSAVGIAITCSGEEIPMLVGAFFIGLSLSLATPAASDILLRYTPATIRSLIFSIKQAAVPLSNVIAGLLVTLTLYFGWSWQITLLSISAFAVAMVVMFQPLRKRWDETRDTASHVTFTWQSFITGTRMLTSSPALRWLAISSFAFVLLQIASTAYLVIFLVEHVQLTHETAGTIFAIAFAGGFFSRIFFGIIADNFISPLKTLGILGLIMGAASIGVAQFEPGWPLWGIAVMTFLLASTAAGWNGVYIAEIANLAPKGQASNVMGMSLVVTYFGCIMTPAIFGLVLATTDSYRIAYTLFAIPSILVGIRLLILKKQ